MSNELSATMIIFGATGDLTHRKLIPALHQLKYNKFLPDNFTVIAVGRKDKTDDQYRKELFESLKKYTTLLIDEESWNSVIQRVFYLKMDFLDPAQYTVLTSLLGGMDNECGLSSNYLFYLAVSPDFIGSIVNNLKSEGILTNARGWHRLVIEKPFGRDLESAYNLNDEITSVFSEDDIFRIDHYLAKEMIQNITMLRFQNSIFEPLWNREYIDNVQITVYEKEGVGTRGSYYDKTGALRDMVQNHLLQSLAITAMDPPKSMAANDIRDQK
ncbi:MAG: glucose-6-phosphate dehydrogenase (NADP(+)), partial [Eubacteriaceae bacterium]|nr:glucose-6-phosphate dehydrogenase (NADP(+)) [Eubacteriaceae bacterium]